MYIQQRSVALCIVFTIFTCGIYGIYWCIKLNDETNAIINAPAETSGGMVILFTILTCGIYGVYWAYKQGDKLNYARMSRGYPSSSLSILYLVLDIFGLGIVAYALMQNEINTLIGPMNNGQMNNQF